MANQGFENFNGMGYWNFGSGQRQQIFNPSTKQFNSECINWTDGLNLITTDSFTGEEKTRFEEVYEKNITEYLKSLYAKPGFYVNTSDDNSVVVKSTNGLVFKIGELS